MSEYKENMPTPEIMPEKSFKDLAQKQEQNFSSEEIKNGEQYPSFIEIHPVYDRKTLSELFFEINQIEEATYREEGGKRALKILEHNQHYQQLMKDYEQKCAEEKESALKQAEEKTAEAWEGRLKLGDWVVVKERDEKGEYISKFKKIIPMSKWSKRRINKDNEEEKIHAVEEYYVLNPKNLKEKIQKHGIRVAEDFDNRYLEINADGILNKEDLRQEYQKLFDKYAVKKKYDIHQILNSLPDNSKLNIEVGAWFKFGSCSHHSGEIEGYLIVLPSGRFAVASQYSGEREELFKEYNLWGAIDNPKTTEPNWSARNGKWTGEMLKELTKEEIAFLRGLDVEFQEEKNVEIENQKMIEDNRL